MHDAEVATQPVRLPKEAAIAPPSYRSLLVFLAPLVFTGVMMVMDTNVVNAALTRLPGAQEALAALVVAFSLALVYEAPHVTMIEVATALATTRQALALLRRFYGVLALVLGVVAALVVFTPLYDGLVRGVMGIPAGVAAAAQPALAVFLLWPVPIGWRRLHQGALIRHGHSRAVGTGATVRILTLGGSLAALLWLFAGTLGGGTIGALAMVLSVTAEAIYTDLAARRLLRALPAAVPGDPLLAPLTRRALWDVFWPLAGTSLLSMLNRPLLSAGIAASALAVAGAGADEAALAAWGLAWSLVMLVNGATLIFSQVAIAWDTDPRPGMGSRGAQVILGVALGLVGVLVALAFTRLGPWLLGQVYGAPASLVVLAAPVLQILAPLPLLMAAGAVLRGRLIARGRARAVRSAQIMDVLVLAAGLGLALAWPDPAWRPGGAVLGALATLAVWTTDLLVLGWSLRSNEQ